ncbi:MAG: hypothetical protein Q9169_008156 [Polycauliona sp. 2 TL-2023]
MAAQAVASSLLWKPPRDTHGNSMTTILILDFASDLDPDGRPIGEAAKIWDRVMAFISKIPGWDSTKWGPRSDDKHGIVVLIVWNFLIPPDDFPLSRKQPLAQSSPLRALGHLLTSEPRLLNVPLFPAPQIADYLYISGTLELELLYLPQNTQPYKEPALKRLFESMTDFVDSQVYRIDTPPWDFHSGHRGWLLETLDSTPVHVIMLHYESLEAEQRFKDPNIAHRGMLQDISPESLYQRKFLDVLPGLADHGVQRESFHFRLNFRAPHINSKSSSPAQKPVIDC